MGYESIPTHEAEGYWLIGDNGERNNCFSKIQLVGKKKNYYIETKHLLQVKAGHQSFFAAKTNFATSGL